MSENPVKSVRIRNHFCWIFFKCRTNSSGCFINLCTVYMSNVPSNAVLLMYSMFYRSRYSDYIYQSTERPFCVPTLCELGDVFCVRPRTIHCMRKASRHEFIEEHETISGNIADFTWFETG